MTDETSEARLTRAKAAMAAGNAQEAFSALRPLLAFPAPEETLAGAFALFVDVSRAFAGADFAETIQRAASGADPQALYDAGYALYEQRLFDVGATYLAKANALAPGQQAILSELAACLEQEMRFGEAVLFLQHSGLADRDPHLRYLLGFHLLMQGDADEAAALLPALQSQAAGNESLVFMANALAGMIDRRALVREATSLDARDLTGWHAVLHGGLLLHESPHGHDSPMHGRYAYLGDSHGLVREGIETLSLVLDALALRPPRILALPDRGSDILGRALAKHLDLPRVNFADHSEEPGLIVAYDLDRIGDAALLGLLHQHRPAQLLFSHASAWVDPFPYAPDATTLLYQHLAAPWEPQMVGPGERSDPDDSPAEEIAARILEASATDRSARASDDVVRIAEALQDQLSLRRTAGRRVHFRKGGPVPSNYFR